MAKPPQLPIQRTGQEELVFKAQGEKYGPHFKIKMFCTNVFNSMSEIICFVRMFLIQCQKLSVSVSTTKEIGIFYNLK
jgi:hypothetical protein